MLRFTCVPNHGKHTRPRGEKIPETKRKFGLNQSPSLSLFSWLSNALINQLISQVEVKKTCQNRRLNQQKSNFFKITSSDLQIWKRLIWGCHIRWKGKTEKFLDFSLRSVVLYVFKGLELYGQTGVRHMCWFMGK